MKWSIKKEGGVTIKKHIIPGTRWSSGDSYGYDYINKTIPVTTGSALGTLLSGGFIDMAVSLIFISLIASMLTGFSPIRFLVCLGVSQLISVLISWGLIASRHTISYKKAIIAWSYLPVINLITLGVIVIILVVVFNPFWMQIISNFKSLFSSLQCY